MNGMSRAVTFVLGSVMYRNFGALDGNQDNALLQTGYESISSVGLLTPTPVRINV